MNKKTKGAIIVRTGSRWSHTNGPIGKIYESMGRSTYGSDGVALKGGWSIHENDCRLATKEEQEVFRQGIRNINDKPKVQKIYEIF